jgi:hypothetical protein
MKQKHDKDGNPVEVANANPILDTRSYEVELPDVTLKEYSANLIAESIFSQVDDEGREYVLLQEIIDHSIDTNAIIMVDEIIGGTKHFH